MMPGEFDAIETPTSAIEVGGQAFRLAPITIGTLPAFTRAIRPVVPSIVPLLDLDEATDPILLSELIMDLVGESGERLIEAVSLALADSVEGAPAERARVSKLNPADFVILALAVIKVNADFFAQRLLPAITKAAQEAKTSLGPGLIPASS